MNSRVSPVIPHSGKDQYFKNEEGLVATFDYDYELITKFRQEETECTLFLFPYPFWIFLPFWFMFGKQNVHDEVYAQHVCITRDGIKYVVEKRNSGCRTECEKVGKVSKTVPFDKITDCDIEEPAGTAVCCFVKNVLTKVNIDTASTNPESHELVISGLKDPHAFKSLVWAMKRGEVQSSSVAQDKELSPNVMQRIGDAQSSAINNFNIGESRAVELLSSIDRRMAEQNELLRQIANK